VSFTEERCITLHCDDCGHVYGYDESEFGGAVHFGEKDSVAARNDAADMDWGITDEGDWCPPCWSKKQCERFGHVPALDVSGEYCDRCEERLVPRVI
jgi:hypothetical protein